MRRTERRTGGKAEACSKATAGVAFFKSYEYCPVCSHHVVSAAARPRWVPTFSFTGVISNASSPVNLMFDPRVSNRSMSTLTVTSSHSIHSQVVVWVLGVCCSYPRLFSPPRMIRSWYGDSRDILIFSIEELSQLSIGGAHFERSHHFYI